LDCEHTQIDQVPRKMAVVAVWNFRDWFQTFV